MLGWTSLRFFRRAWFQVNLVLWKGPNGEIWRPMVWYYLLLNFIWPNFLLSRPSPTKRLFPPHLGFCTQEDLLSFQPLLSRANVWQRKSTEFSRVAHVWHLPLVRDDVDLLSRAGDQRSTHLGWIPDSITELQHDLGWRLCCLHYLIPASVFNGPYPWPNSPWSVVHHQCTKSCLLSTKLCLTPQRCFIGCGWICSPVVVITVVPVCGSVSEQSASILVSRKKATTPSVWPLSTATHCCHSLLFHLSFPQMSVFPQIFRQFLIFSPSISAPPLPLL